MKKRWNLVLVLLVIITLLTGCFTSPQQGEPGGEAPTVLVIWHSLTGNELKALENQLNRIMDNYPEIIIKAEYIPEGKMVNESYYAQAGGKGPDIFIGRSEILNQLYAKGGLAEFAGSIKDDFPAASALFKIGELYFAKAWLTDVPLLYYRKDIIKTPPTTVSEMFNVEEGKLKPALALSKLTVSYLSPFWASAGGTVYTQGKPALESSANLEFAKQLQTWFKDKQLTVTPDAVNLFASGEAQFLIDSAARAFELSRKNIQWASMPLTKLTGGKTILIGETLGIANSVIKTDPQRLEQIALVEDELLSPETESALHKVKQRLPASTAYYLREEAKGAYYKEVNNALNQSWVLESNAWERKLLPLLDEGWNGILAGLEPEEAIKRSQNKGLKILESLK